MKKLTEKIQSKLDAIKDALYHRFVRPLREDIVRRGGDTVARGLDLSATEVAQHLSIDAFDVAQEINKSEIASHIDVEEIASYVEVGAEDVAQEISPHEIASELDFHSLADHIDVDDELAQAIAKHLEVPEVRVEYRKIVEGLLKALLSGEGLPKQGDTIHSQGLTVERTEDAS
jgi:hypothetical protein